MKSIFLSLFLFLCFASYAQTYKPKTFTISREKIEKAEKIQEIIPDCPQNCGFSGCSLTKSTAGGIKLYSVFGSKITPSLRAFILSDGEKKPKFFIDNIHCSCQSKLFKSYQFTITD